MELTGTLIQVAGAVVALSLVGVVFYAWGSNRGYNQCLKDQQDAEAHERRIQKTDNRIEAPRDPNAPRAVVRPANFKRSL